MMHLGPDGTQTYHVSVAQCLDALYDSALHCGALSVVPRKSLLVVATYGREDIHADIYYGTLADLDSWDPFAADDGWPGPAVGGYSCIVSPHVRLEDVPAALAYYGDLGMKLYGAQPR